MLQVSLEGGRTLELNVRLWERGCFIHSSASILFHHARRPVCVWRGMAVAFRGRQSAFSSFAVCTAWTGEGACARPTVGFGSTGHRFTGHLCESQSY